MLFIHLSICMCIKLSEHMNQLEGININDEFVFLLCQELLGVFSNLRNLQNPWAFGRESKLPKSDRLHEIHKSSKAALY